MSVWTNINIEAYCLFNYLSKKNHIYYKLLNTKEIKFDKKHPFKQKNINYIAPSNRPGWCVKSNKKLIPQFNCLCENKNQKCKFFTFCEANKK